MKNHYLVVLLFGFLFNAHSQKQDIVASEVIISEIEVDGLRFNDEIMIFKSLLSEEGDIYKITTLENSISLTYSELRDILKPLINEARWFNEEDKSLIQNAYPYELVRVNSKERSFVYLSFENRTRQVKYRYYFSIETLNRLKTELDTLIFGDKWVFLDAKIGQ